MNNRFMLKQETRVVVVFPARSVEKHLECTTRMEALCAALGVVSRVQRVGRDDVTAEIVESADLIIAVGGDGTTLDVARHVEHTPVLSLKLKDDSVGFLCSGSVSEAISVVNRLVNGECRIEKRQRLQVFVDGQAVGSAVYNDVLIANLSPARASRYQLCFSEHSERQCSSGVWIATASGSHAAARSAGAKPLDVNDSRAMLRVRELNQANCSDPTVEFVFIPESTPEIISDSDHLVAFGDGDLWRHSISRGSHISFGYATPLFTVVFN